MKTVTKALAWTGGVSAALEVLSAALYSRLSDSIPVHWGLSGEPDSWASRPWIFAVALMPVGLAALAAASGRRAMEAGPGSEPEAPRRREGTVVVAMGASAALATGLYAFALAAALGVDPAAVRRCVAPVIGLALVALGNVLPRVKRNRMLGVRLPWAYGDDRTWAVTQRFGGAALVALGLLFMTTFFMTGRATAVVVAAGLVAFLAATTAVSLIAYKASKSAADSRADQGGNDEND